MAMTFTYDEGGVIRKIIAAWTSDAGGDASGTTKKIVGELLRGVTDPSATAAPTDDYDIVITDEEGVDVLGNCDDDLVDRDTANTESVEFIVATATGARPVVADKLTFTVAAAGDAKAGQIIVYYRFEVP